MTPTATALPAAAGVVVDAAPVTTGGVAMWLLLGDGGRIGRWHAGSGAYERLAAASVPAEADRDRWAGRVPRPRLHASADGRFAAVVNDYGRFGQVFDLRTGDVTMALDNAGDEEDTVPFSLAFLEVGGRTAVVHRTAWNRLDVSVAATGEPLTVRSAPADYFHGALHLSPDGLRILDDGWIWHPVGAVTVVGVEQLLAQEEPLGVCARDYYWDHAMTWIDGTRVAVEGIGDDDARMRAGARVFDVGRTEVTEDWPVPHAVEVAVIPGPAGRFFSDGALLYSADADGLHHWDPFGGERLGTVAGFSPTHHHRAGGVFLELRDGAALTWAAA